jgi:hypothetical protein
MAKVIKFYVPARFRKVVKWVPQQEHGRVLEFAVTQKRGASHSGTETSCKHRMRLWPRPSLSRTSKISQKAGFPNGSSICRLRQCGDSPPIR